MPNNRENGEKRLLGAALVITRENSNGQPEILLIKDRSKEEISAGGRVWSLGNRNIFGLPGGGRGIVTESDGETRGETREETLTNETKEELGMELSPEDFKNTQIQSYPLLVAQLGISVINVLAVTSELLQFDSLSAENRNFITKKITKNKARWVKLEDIARAFKYFSEHQQYLKKAEKRPHVYTIAFLWSLELIANWIPDNVLDIIGNELNQTTYKAVLSRSDIDGLKIKNGAFNDRGNVLLPDELSPEDREFLYESIKKSKTS